MSASNALNRKEALTVEQRAEYRSSLIERFRITYAGQDWVQRITAKDAGNVHRKTYYSWLDGGLSEKSVMSQRIERFLHEQIREHSFAQRHKL